MFNILKEPIQRKVIYIILISVLGFVGLSVFKIYYIDQNLSKLEQKEQNQIAKKEIGDLISIELMQLHLDIVHFIMKSDLKEISYYKTIFYRSNIKINKLLNILQSGGIFTNSFKVNFNDKDEIKQIIKYEKPKKEGFVLEVIELRPKIIEINEEIVKIINLKQNFEKCKELKLKQKGFELINVLEKQIHTLLLRSNEIERKIVFDVTIELQEIRNSKLVFKEKTFAILIKTKIVVILIVLFVSVLLIIQIKKNIQKITSEINNRKKAEKNLIKSEEKLTILHEVSTLLSKCSSENELWKMAVELGKSKLAFDRIGIWLITNKPNELRGTFGTSLNGKLIDENHLKGRNDPNGNLDKALKLKSSCLYIENEKIMDYEIKKVVGYAERAIAPLWNGDKAIGIISIDNFILQKHITENDRNLLALYASFIGHLATRLRTVEKQMNLERQVRHAQKLESLGVLAGGIAHDFNNILMGVLGYADLALRELPSHSPIRNNLIEIDKAACRAADLAKQMLAYSGKGKFIIESIFLNNFINEMVHILEVSISKKIILKYNFSNDLPTFKGDATQIRQIIMNLITNASESMDGKSGVVSLSTGAMFCDRKYLDFVSSAFLDELDDPLQEGTYVYIEVADTGCGMDDDVKEKIFDPFFTTKFTGRGLGMAAVLGIVRGHKGAIKIHSVKGKGTTFKVLFPADSESINSSTKKTGALENKDVWKGDGAFLIADDEETVCAVGKHILESVGFRVLIAEDGKKAVDVFRKNADDIVCVLLDLSMPYLSGTEVFQKIKNINPDIKVILSSGYNEQDIKQKFVGKDLDGFIQKPYVPKILLEKIREVLNDK